MDELICRLCLMHVSNDAKLVLTVGCDIINKLSFCLSHHIDITPDLPSIICKMCIETVEEIFTFREKIIKNEYFLQNKLKDPICETKYAIKKEDSKTTCEVKEIKTACDRENIENRIDSIIKEEPGDSISNIKEENEIIDDTYSEDNDSKDIEVLQQNKSSLNENNMCLTCFSKFPSRLDLLHHYHNVEKLKHNTCDTEKKQFKYRAVNLNGKVSYKCEECDKEYRSEKFIKRHFVTHMDRPFLCKLCGTTFRTATNIVKHAKVHGDKVFVCSFKCGYRSVHKHVIKDHERRHRNEFRYTCETCGKRFHNKSWYIQHQNIHTGAKPYVCKYCGMAFHLDRYLTQHRSKVHPKEITQKRYMCIHCSTPFSSKPGLALHLKEHDIDGLVGSLCDECGKVLKNARQLKCHKRVHMETKPYVCSTCNKSFTQKYSLVVHQLSHTDTRYPCDKCDKRFSQRSSLNRHLLSCREFVEKCATCSKTFYNKKDYLKHNKTCN